jgi:hypothetical protein
MTAAGSAITAAWINSDSAILAICGTSITNVLGSQPGEAKRPRIRGFLAEPFRVAF